MTKVQANVNDDVVKHVNHILKSIGQTPNNLINSLYYAIDKTGTIPFKMGLTSEQYDSLKVQRLALRQKPKVIKNKKEFDKLWRKDEEN